MRHASLLTGENAAYVDDQYRAWREDPGSVDPELAAMFAAWGADGPAPRGPSFEARSIFNPAASGPGVAREALVHAAEKQGAVTRLIHAFRVRGHLEATVDPLDRWRRPPHPELTLAHYGLTDDDLDRTVRTEPLMGMPRFATVREVYRLLRKAYAGSIGAEFMHIHNLEERDFVIEALETVATGQVLDAQESRRILRKLSDAEAFEQLIHGRFPGTKRFSLEGAETLIPLLDLLIEQSAHRGVHTVVLGMAHRGRLNVLANILEKPVGDILEEFGGAFGDGHFQDVKYHLGFNTNVRTLLGDPVDLQLAFNPSHLEAVSPVVSGRVRARQDRSGDTGRRHVLPVTIHGDAAFAGQGLVMETLNLSELDGYATGGTVRILVNNQIGFTTAPSRSRSTTYATDVARMLNIPVFHVNGEDPQAVAAVTSIAAEWRRRFQRDVIIDMYCYRRYGHNEGDEPSFTQPLMYKVIRSRPTPRANFARRLVDAGTLTQAEAEQILAEARDQLEQTTRPPEPLAPAASSPFSLGDLARWYRGGIQEEVDTTLPIETLTHLLNQANSLPEGFHAHRKIVRLFEQRREAIAAGQGLDWAFGEQAAFATLLQRGVPVRLSGQDSGRGTFSHRHAVVTDIRDNSERVPLQHLDGSRSTFEVVDSSLSEAGVLGFEFGYSMDYPDALVMWEAQFGDFANGAQVIIDQFVAASEAKWKQFSSLVMLLPHGYEGQGPEHSSGRLERYLQLCAEDNLQVAYCSTTANFSHLLRRQALRQVRKPLIVMTPKSLLRHPGAASSLEELASGHFERVLQDPAPLDPAAVERVVLCSGKVYYDLLDERTRRDERRVALVRVELLYPFPAAQIAAALAAWPASTEVVWCQEEPRNMGAWPTFHHWFAEHLPQVEMPRYAGRTAAAAPAAGSHRLHVIEQQRLMAQALDLQEEEH
ncbi:MAG: 2-oxoglutarate dehydrogenase E1 component [Deltaproteobacteria bacterium]|nr:2-oxoglutarate dehydrogenase E1 component [Deltaproteobacteria bacterium]